MSQHLMTLFAVKMIGLFRNIGLAFMKGDNKMQRIATVDLRDDVLGYETKKNCHSVPLLHRAFSVFLVHDGKMMIQQRAIEKYHSGGLWTNSCCSHMREGEDMSSSISLRLEEELGINCECWELFSFVYYHRFAEDLYEYEIDHVYIGDFDGEIQLNPEEAMDMQWISYDELEEDVLKHPQKYTVWFITALPRVLKILRETT